MKNRITSNHWWCHIVECVTVTGSMWSWECPNVILDKLLIFLSPCETYTKKKKQYTYQTYVWYVYWTSAFQISSYGRQNKQKQQIESASWVIVYNWYHHTSCTIMVLLQLPTQLKWNKSTSPSNNAMPPLVSKIDFSETKMFYFPQNSLHLCFEGY